MFTIRQRIIDYLAAHPEGTTSFKLAGHIAANPNSVQAELHRLMKKTYVVRHHRGTHKGYVYQLRTNV